MLSARSEANRLDKPSSTAQPVGSGSPLPASQATEIRTNVRDRLNRAVARKFFVLGAGVCLFGSASISLQDLHLSRAMQFSLVAACAVMASLFGWAGWNAARLPPKAAVLGTAWAGCALVTLIAVGSGFSIQSHTLGFFGLLVCLVAVLAGGRHAGAMTLFAAAVIGALAAAESAGQLNGAATVAAAPPSDPVISQLLLLAGGLGVGLIVARVADASFRAFADREERFHTLLKMAADRYFELDSELRFVRADASTSSILAATPDSRIGLRPWETADKLGMTPDQQHKHFDDLKAHRPFNRLRTTVRLDSGLIRHLDSSGQPRFDIEGKFLGYWGVARDVTEEVSAELAIRRSRMVLAMLFENSPDCITLSATATGRYKMVNPGFTRLLGYPPEEAVGRTSLELGLWRSQADFESCAQMLRSTGQITEQRCDLLAKGGRRVTMLVSAARCVIDDEDCVVVNARDVTYAERARLEYAAILERASIGIAFLRNRSFARVNPCFERMFGWEDGSLAGNPSRVIWPSEKAYAQARQFASPLFDSGEPIDVEHRMRRKDGSIFLCRTRARALDPADPTDGGTIWIAEDVTEQRQIEASLARARDAAEAASRAKSAFLANTSHEIRTPLNGLLGMAQLAMQSDVDPARRQQYLGHILDSAQNLAGIISDILDLSKIEAGRIDIERLSFSLRDLLDAVHQAYQSMAEAKGLELTLVLADDLPAQVNGDPLRVRQILSNFITNALKFTERGRVCMQANRAAGERIRLAVVDTGPGISEANQQRLFKPFTQGDESTTRRFGGTGLGLSICSELARLMGGEVGLQSAPDQGSTFWAELPLPECAPPALPHVTVAEELEDLRGTRVLIAEDNLVNMLIVVALLEQWGMQVTQVFDGHRAVDAVKQAAQAGQPFALVLMDVHMPNMSGHAAARKLREQYGAGELPIIALSAAALVSERDAALEAGMCEFLTKPIDADRLRRTMARCVKPAARANSH